MKARHTLNNLYKSSMCTLQPKYKLLPQLYLCHYPHVNIIHRQKYILSILCILQRATQYRQYSGEITDERIFFKVHNAHLLLQLNKSASPKNTLCRVWLKLAQWIWKRRFLNVNVFSEKYDNSLDYFSPLLTIINITIFT